MAAPSDKKPHPDPRKEEILSLILPEACLSKQPPGESFWCNKTSASVWEEIKSAPADWTIVLCEYLQQAQWLPEDEQERQQCLNICRLSAACNQIAWRQPASSTFAALATEHPISWQDPGYFKISEDTYLCRNLGRHSERSAFPPIVAVGFGGVYVRADCSAARLDDGHTESTFELYAFENGTTRLLTEMKVPAQPLIFCFSHDGKQLAVYLANETIVLVRIAELTSSLISLSCKSPGVSVTKDSPVAYFKHLPPRIDEKPILIEFSRTGKYLLVAGAEFIQIIDVDSQRVARHLCPPFIIIGACWRSDLDEILLIAIPDNMKRSTQPAVLYELLPFSDDSPIKVLTFDLSNDEITAREATFHLLHHADFVYAFSKSSTIRFFPSQRMLQSLGGPGAAQLLAASPDGQTVIFTQSYEDERKPYLLTVRALPHDSVPSRPVPRDSAPPPPSAWGGPPTPPGSGASISAQQGPYPSTPPRPIVFPSISSPAGSVWGYLDENTLINFGLGLPNIEHTQQPCVGIRLCALNGAGSLGNLIPELGRLICASPDEYRTADLEFLKSLAEWDTAPESIKVWLPLLEQKILWKLRS